MAFEIDPRILASSEPLASLELCDARVQADARFPWIVLVPRRPGLREIEELAPEDRALLLDEVVRTGAAIRAMGEALGRPVEKLNVGALGNVVAQLHVHVVGRRSDDPAWPGPVWGFGQAEAYEAEALQKALDAARPLLLA
jgi:diadenosine tetraphosphate (Ap4A) HIT family hydrolase